MGITVKIANTQKEKEICLSIRRKVFIEEQRISEKIELDDDKINGMYFLASFEKDFVGTARYRISDQGIKLERFAVLKTYRNLGIGKELVRFILNSLKNKNYIYLHAQESVINFYARLGFKSVGSKFYEAEIPHQKMFYSG